MFIAMIVGVMQTYLLNFISAIGQIWCARLHISSRKLRLLTLLSSISR